MDSWYTRLLNRIIKTINPDFFWGENTRFFWEKFPRDVIRVTVLPKAGSITVSVDILKLEMREIKKSLLRYNGNIYSFKTEDELMRWLKAFITEVRECLKFGGAEVEVHIRQLSTLDIKIIITTKDPNIYCFIPEDYFPA